MTLQVRATNVHVELTTAEWELLERFIVVLRNRMPELKGRPMGRVVAAMMREYLLRNREEILEEYAALQIRQVERHAILSPHERALAEAARAAEAPDVPVPRGDAHRGPLYAASAYTRPV